MPMALQPQHTGKVKISEANAWRMVFNTTTKRRPLQTLRHAYISTLSKLELEHEKGQIKKWMTVARETDQHGERSLNPVWDFPPAPSRIFAGSDEKTNDKMMIENWLSSLPFSTCKNDEGPRYVTDHNSL
jgi:hypothetical protein